MVPIVTNLQMWIFLVCPGLRTRPTACISKATASSRVAASIGCTMMTWFAAVKFVPLADSSKDNSSIRGPLSSYWNLVKAARRAHTLPMRLMCSTPNSSRAAPTLRFRSSHCTKQITLHVGCSRRSLCTWPTSASIFEPYLAKRCPGNSVRAAGAVAAAWESSRLCRKETRELSLFSASCFKATSCFAQLSVSAFHTFKTWSSFSALALSRSHSQFACSSSSFSAPGAPGQRGIPKWDRSLAHLPGAC
mmetsp:Transcript_25510/g.73676  ORF Transcript_25510/g.73676 Transcript_25510/m.73676 type:complete len:248 (+) Transcript_25510:527-1270(+)